ncbi:MAG: hypothetical protein IKR79_03355, partial [Bacteroidales bacterium]|nr:hypothetical protein [Bacteroidales bacterium]
MKKTALFAAAAALLLFGACQKDGKYNPKEKISNVSEEYCSVYSYFSGEEWVTDSSITPKHVSEQWTWDGKKLSQIAYIGYDYDDQGNMVPDGQDLVKFNYDGSQMTEVTTSYGERMTFTYDGKKLQKAELYDGAATPYMTYEFEHDGKKISSMTVTMDEEYYAKKGTRVGRLEHLLLGNIIPQTKSTDKFVCQMHAKAAKSTESVKMDLTWDGDNVSKITAVTPYGNATMTLNYDDKNNPFKSFGPMFGFYGETETGVEFCNKNNITKMVISDIEG